MGWNKTLKNAGNFIKNYNEWKDEMNGLFSPDDSKEEKMEIIKNICKRAEDVEKNYCVLLNKEIEDSE